MTNGDYVYILSTISDIYQERGLDYWWWGISGKVNRSEAEKAWHSVLTLVPRPYNVTKYKQFQDQVVNKSGEFPKKTNETLGQVSKHIFKKLVRKKIVTKIG